MQYIIIIDINREKFIFGLKFKKFIISTWLKRVITNIEDNDKPILEKYFLLILLVSLLTIILFTLFTHFFYQIINMIYFNHINNLSISNIMRKV